MVAPDHQEFRDPVAGTNLRLTKLVLPVLDRSVALKRVDLERLCQQFTTDFIANALARIGHHRLAIKACPARVVIELDIRRKVLLEMRAAYSGLDWARTTVVAMRSDT